MEAVFTLPAEAFVQTNGSPLSRPSVCHPLAGNSIWAVGHLPDSSAHSLHFFSGVKGGTFRWHTFRAPKESAEEVELELAFEGSLGLRMDRELFLGTVQSVSDLAISWSRAATSCRDFQLGRDYFCHRQTDSDTFVLTQIDQPEHSRALPPAPAPPDCYCLSSRDELLLLSGSLLFLLAPPYARWTQIETAPPPRPLLSLFAPSRPVAGSLCLSRGHLCALSRDGETLSLLSLVPAPVWRQLPLPARARQICPVSGPALSFLIIDRHFLLSRASLDAGALRPLDLLPACLPEREVLSCVRAIRSLFDTGPDTFGPLLSPLSPASSAPPQEAFFTAGSPGPLEMELDPTADSVPSADPAYSVASADPAYSGPTADPCYSVPSADPCYSVATADPAYSDPTADPAYSVASADPAYSVASADPAYSVASVDPAYSVPTADPAYSAITADPAYSAITADPAYSDPSDDWLLSDPIISNNISEVKTGSKRATDSEFTSPHKLSKTEASADSYPHRPVDTCFHTGTFLPEGTPGRTSEERRTHKRYLRGGTGPCPLNTCCFVSVAHNVSHFETLLEEARAHAGTTTPIERVQGLLFEQEFDFSLAVEERSGLSRLFPEPPRPASPGPASAPPTVPHFQL